MLPASHYIRRFKLTHGLSEEELKLLHGLLQEQDAPQGTELFQQGQLGTGMYLITKGTVSVVVTSESGQEVEVAHESGPTVMGELGLITGNLASATVRASTDIHVALLSEDAFETLMETRGKLVARLVLNIARVLAYRLDSTNAALAAAVGNERSREIAGSVGATWGPKE